MRNCYTLNDIKEAWQLTAMSHPGLDQKKMTLVGKPVKFK